MYWLVLCPTAPLTVHTGYGLLNKRVCLPRGSPPIIRLSRTRALWPFHVGQLPPGACQAQKEIRHDTASWEVAKTAVKSAARQRQRETHTTPRRASCARYAYVSCLGPGSPHLMFGRARLS